MPFAGRNKCFQRSTLHSVGSRKQRLLGSVACLALPTTVPETGSLVSMEALASGTPVVAFRTPPLAELIESGRTGFLVADADEMRRAFTRIDSISAAECRRAAEAHCALDAMTRGYLNLYQTLVLRFTATASADTVRVVDGPSPCIYRL